ncbi:MAG: flavin reductase family protein [Candidatus Heimdallarchaeota archaeon]|nr:flavin reductase family protein [Candidatus Heimdallarchaeota archaeon]
MKIEENPNSAFYPNPVVLVSVQDETRESIITLAWVGTSCSDPPILSLSIRPNRYSNLILKNSKECVVNFPTIDMLKQVKFCGTKSGKEVNKWDECHFIKRKSHKVAVPAIEACPVNMECKIEQIIPLGTHDLFLARVVALLIDESWKQQEYPKMLTFTRGKYGEVISL